MPDVTPNLPDDEGRLKELQDKRDNTDTPLTPEEKSELTRLEGDEEKNKAESQAPDNAPS